MALIDRGALCQISAWGSDRLIILGMGEERMRKRSGENAPVFHQLQERAINHAHISAIKVCRAFKKSNKRRQVLKSQRGPRTTFLKKVVRSPLDPAGLLLLSSLGTSWEPQAEIDFRTAPSLGRGRRLAPRLRAAPAPLCAGGRALRRGSERGGSITGARSPETAISLCEARRGGDVPPSAFFFFFPSSSSLRNARLPALPFHTSSPRPRR